jgi:lipoprotein-anchoring transpeptidase ErfK/SrfK
VRQRTQRTVTVLAVAIVVLLATAASTAVGRLRPAPGVAAVVPIHPSFTMAYEPPATALDALLKPRPAPPKTTTGARSCPAMPVVPLLPDTAASAVGPRLDVYDAPDGRRVRSLTNPTIEGQRLNVLVVERAGIWLRVRLPMRPNGTTGWVRLTDVSQYEAPFRIVVQLCAHRLTVFRGGKAVWAQPVAVGAPRTPTPKGEFYVDFVTPMRYGGAYGPYLLSVAGFSNVLHQFGKNGIGQIGIHGTNRPASIGTSASHGCVRLHNDALLTLVKLVPPGTPVTIVD